jgi:hypothetical protein
MPRVRSVLLFLCLLSFCVGVASADRRHAPWRDLGHEVSVRVWQVTGVKDTWSWDFRNDGPETITSLRFVYLARHPDGSTYTRSDIVPGDLRPGQTIGGWIAFTADSISEPTIVLKEVRARGRRR